MQDRIEKQYIHQQSGLNWKLVWVGMIIGLMILAVSFWSAKARAGNYDEDEDKVYICHCQGEGQEINCTTKHLGVSAARRHLQNHEADYRGRCEVPPTSTPTPSPTPTPTPVEECDKDECQPTTTPTPTEPARQADSWSCEVDHSCQPTNSAPQCTATKPGYAPQNFHVYRNGDYGRPVWFEDASVTWKVVVYYGLTGQGDQHSVVLNNNQSGDYKIEGLNSTDVDFRATFLNDCAEGPSTKAIIDGATRGEVLFR